jgi:hypothetical protein
MNNTIKWKFNDMDVQFVSPVDKFDEHVYKFSNKFGVNKHKITILENGSTDSHDSSSDVNSSTESATDLPKRTRSRSPKSSSPELQHMSGVLDESDSTSDNLADTASDSGDSESSNGGDS